MRKVNAAHMFAFGVVSANLFFAICCRYYLQVNYILFAYKYLQRQKQHENNTVNISKASEKRLLLILLFLRKNVFIDQYPVTSLRS